jgi:hypothetical protein
VPKFLAVVVWLVAPDFILKELDEVTAVLSLTLIKPFREMICLPEMLRALIELVVKRARSPPVEVVIT